jgi:hypothetical protein
MTYYAEIERYFISRRGRGLMLSPKDWQVMSEWERQQIPLRVVLQGINNTFCQKGSMKQEVNFLAYCKSQVNKCWREHKKQALAAVESSDSEPDSSRQLILKHISAIKQKLEAGLSQTGPFLEVFCQVQDALKQLKLQIEDNNFTFTHSLGEQFDAIYQQLLEGIRARMPKQELERIMGEVEAELKNYRCWMQADAYHSTYAALVDERLCRHYNLPQIRLYEL